MRREDDTRAQRDNITDKEWNVRETKINTLQIISSDSREGCP